jgi:hypothetical protein
MTDTTGFDAYNLYNGLRLHFTGTYDFIKYNGKTSLSRSTFSTRKDKYQFYQLSRRYQIDELKQFYIANFIEKDIQWVGELCTPQGEETYKKWQKRNQSLTYVFEQDIIHLFNKYSPNDILGVVDDFYPRLLEEVMQGEVSLETLCILNDILQFLPMWDRKISDDIVWPRWRQKMVKYTPFIVFDKNKLKNVIKERYKEHAEA